MDPKALLWHSFLSSQYEISTIFVKKIISLVTSFTLSSYKHSHEKSEHKPTQIEFCQKKIKLWKSYKRGHHTHPEKISACRVLLTFATDQRKFCLIERERERVGGVFLWIMFDYVCDHFSNLWSFTKCPFQQPCGPDFLFRTNSVPSMSCRDTHNNSCPLLLWVIVRLI